MAANLPVFPTPFVGRQDELASIARRLIDPACRLLTLLGPGGIGKTRLAVESARMLQERFADGIYFAALQPLASPDLIVPAIAGALELDFYPGGDPNQQLIDALRNRELLLVMDNFEHLLNGAPVLSDLLNAAPQIKILTTSRERLNLVEEWTFDVAGLAVPESAGEQPIADYDAVRLFVQSAQRVQASFHMTEAQQAAVSRICQLVGGMPLGIEMAAAWVRGLSCDEIAAEIEQSMDILATTARNVPPRHRSMRAALDHSWTLLNAQEQHSFKWLSVFRGGFTREAATFVSGASVWTLTALVDKSLLRVDAQGRYHVQELLRQYAEHQLEVAGEMSEARDWHAAYFAEFLRQRWDTLRSEHQPQALREVDAELDNVRAAWHVLCQQRNASALHDAAPALWYASDLRCRFQDMVSLFDEGAAALRSIEPTPEGTRAQGLLLALLGWSHVGIGLPDKGQQLAHEGLALLETTGDSEDRFLALLSLQLTTHFSSRIDEFQQVSQRAIAVARQSGNDWGVARSWYELANFNLGDPDHRTFSAAERRAEFEKAKEIAEECLRLAEKRGDLWLRASISGFFLGNIYHLLGDYAEEKRRYEQSLPFFEEVGQSWSFGAVYRLLGLVSCELKEYAPALQYFLTSLDVYHRNGQVHEQLTTLCGTGDALALLGDKIRAIQVMTVIARHPGSLDFARSAAVHALQKLETDVPADRYRAAVERANGLQLEDVVTGLVASRDERPPQPDTQNPDTLTKRELEVLKLMSSGMNNRQIADHLTLSLGTVKWYSSQILSKLHAQNRIQALAQARALDLLA